MTMVKFMMIRPEHGSRDDPIRTFSSDVCFNTYKWELRDHTELYSYQNTLHLGLRDRSHIVCPFQKSFYCCRCLQSDPLFKGLFRYSWFVCLFPSYFENFFSSLLLTSTHTMTANTTRLPFQGYTLFSKYKLPQYLMKTEGEPRLRTLGSISTPCLIFKFYFLGLYYQF